MYVLVVDSVECLDLVCVVCDAGAHRTLWMVIIHVYNLAVSMFCCFSSCMSVFLRLMHTARGLFKLRLIKCIKLGCS